MNRNQLHLLQNLLNAINKLTVNLLFGNITSIGHLLRSHVWSIMMMVIPSIMDDMWGFVIQFWTYFPYCHDNSWYECDHSQLQSIPSFDTENSKSQWDQSHGFDDYEHQNGCEDFLDFAFLATSWNVSFWVRFNK